MFFHAFFMVTCREKSYKISHENTIKSFENPVNLPWINSQDIHGFLVYSETRWNWLGQFTNNSLRATTATRELQKGIPENFAIQRVGHRYVRSLQKNQRLHTSSQSEISKKFNCCVKSCHYPSELLLNGCR